MRSVAASPYTTVLRCASVTTSQFKFVRLVSSKSGGSSARYLQRQRKDVFVKQRLNADLTRGNEASALSSGVAYVSRSAFKLLQLDDKYRFLRTGRTIVDLGAAPGGWSQAIIERVRKDRSHKHRQTQEESTSASIYALDILPMSPVEGVTCLQGDFLDTAIQERLRRKVLGVKKITDDFSNDETGKTDAFVDVVLSDMMANTSGNSVSDSEASLSLCQAAYQFAIKTLRPNIEDETRKFPPRASTASVLVMKFFMSHEAEQFRKQVLEKSFQYVKAEKMEASRKASREQFWVCIGFKAPLPSIEGARGHNSQQ